VAGPGFDLRGRGLCSRPDIVRCLTRAKNIKKSLNKSADARPGTGRSPSGHRPMFYETNCHRWEATCFCSIYCIYIDISLLKTKNINTKNIYRVFRLSNWGWLTCNEQVLLKFLKSWASVVSITITVRVSLNRFYLNNLFLWRNDGQFWYKWIHHCTWKFA